MDGGIDDALALILALRSPELEVVGISAVSGNVPVEQATMNALRIVELVKRPEVWVTEGRAHPLEREPIRAYEFHGHDGLGDSNLPPPKLRATRKDAHRAIVETLTSSRKHELTIICTGPLTNLAVLLQESPDTSSMIDEVVIMGGAYMITRYGVGNETPVAEFNIFSDPEAAKLVFRSGIRLKAVGLDATTIPRLELTRQDYMKIERKTSAIAGFTTRILQSNIRVHGRFTLHDPLAVAVKIRPSCYKFSDYHVEVETKGEHTTGMTVADQRHWLSEKQLSGKIVSVCRDVDPRFKQMFLARLMAD